MRTQEIRPFISSNDFKASVQFYLALGFLEEVITDQMSLFTQGKCRFFLYQDTQGSTENKSMAQLVVEDIQQAYNKVAAIEEVDITFEAIRRERWGQVFYLWGPSGELWHVTELDAR